MTLTKDSIEWAIDFVHNHSDGDLFPKILELKAIFDCKKDFANEIAGKPLKQFAPKSCRRFIVPKDDISYRQATQLHPQDSIILSSIIYQFGLEIEKRRLSPKQVFSYRFLPTETNGLYDNRSAWNDFWNEANKKAVSHDIILYCDIADFYNQIYHHTVENQLIAAGLPNQATKWIITLFEATTANVSRGIPIGPHAAHLIAEASLIPVDNSLNTKGINFIRYADDIIIFCSDKREAKHALSILATTLDKQQRLTLQRHKTKFFSPTEFQILCSEMIEDRPIDTNEEELLKTIRKYTGGNPYKTISYNKIQPLDWNKFSSKKVSGVISEYLSRDNIDYIRLRWFYRRLAQVGHPGAIDISINNLEKLEPCLPNICAYIASIQSIEPDEWKNIGEKLIRLFETDEVQDNEFFRLSILSLFTKNPFINHFNWICSSFNSSDSFVRREILLAAYQNKAEDWLREHKESYQIMDEWQQMALIYSASLFPSDERKYFINSIDHKDPFEKTLAKWSKT